MRPTILRRILWTLGGALLVVGLGCQTPPKGAIAEAPSSSRLAAADPSAPTRVTEIQSDFLNEERLAKRQLQVLWHAPLAGEELHAAYVVGDILCLETKKHRVYALDLASGYARWVKQLALDLDVPPVASLADLFLISSYRVHQIDLVSGKLKWEDKLSFPVSSSPSVLRGYLYFGSWDDHVHALRFGRRLPRWSFLATDNIRARPHFADGVLYAAAEDGHITAYQPGTKNVVWRFRADGKITGDLVAERNVLYVPCRDYRLYSVGTGEGRALWTFHTEGQILRAPWLTPDAILLAAEDDGLYAVDRDTGRQLWHLRDARHPVALSPSRLYCRRGRQQILCTQVKTGDVQWQASMAPFVMVPDNIRTGAFYLISKDCHVYAVAEKGARTVPLKEAPPVAAKAVPAR
jgi:outer membrane protein assembly factor BamB